MQLILCSKDRDAFLEETEIINSQHPIIHKKIIEFQHIGKDKHDTAQLVYRFVRDGIHHSVDKDSTSITIRTTDTMERKEGNCFAKSHLLVITGNGFSNGFMLSACN
jgi:hypothetical protein